MKERNRGNKKTFAGVDEDPYQPTTEELMRFQFEKPTAQTPGDMPAGEVVDVKPENNQHGIARSWADIRRNTPFPRFSNNISPVPPDVKFRSNPSGK